MVFCCDFPDGLGVLTASLLKVLLLIPHQASIHDLAHDLSEDLMLLLFYLVNALQQRLHFLENAFELIVSVVVFDLDFDLAEDVVGSQPMGVHRDFLFFLVGSSPAEEQCVPMLFGDGLPLVPLALMIEGVVDDLLQWKILLKEFQILLLVVAPVLHIPPHLQLVESFPCLLPRFLPCLQLIEQIGFTRFKMALLVVIVLDHVEFPLVQLDVAVGLHLELDHGDVLELEHVDILRVDELLFVVLDPKCVHAVEQDFLLLFISRILADVREPMVFQLGLLCIHPDFQKGVDDELFPHPLHGRSRKEPFHLHIFPLVVLEEFYFFLRYLASPIAHNLRLPFEYFLALVLIQLFETPVDVVEGQPQVGELVDSFFTEGPQTLVQQLVETVLLGVLDQAV